MQKIGLFMMLVLFLGGCSVVTLPVKVVAKTAEVASDVVGEAVDVVD